jgi:hypothetical protein
MTLLGIVVVIRALIATPPDPTRVRRSAESIPIQGQGRLAMTDVEFPALREHTDTILDARLRPATVLPPDPA